MQLMVGDCGLCSYMMQLHALSSLSQHCWATAASSANVLTCTQTQAHSSTLKHTQIPSPKPHLVLPGRPHSPPHVVRGTPEQT